MTRKVIILIILLLIKLPFFQGECRAISKVFAVNLSSSPAFVSGEGIQENSKLNRIDALIIKAASCKNERDYQKTINLYNKALKLSKEVNDPLRLSTIHYYLGTTYLEIQNYTLAISAFEACLKLKSKVYRPELFAMVAFNLGAIYADFKNFDLALNYYQAALEGFKHLEKHDVAGEVLDSIGVVHLAHGSPQKAISNYLKALEYKREVNADKEVAVLLMKIGALYLDLEEHDKALVFLKDALQYRHVSQKAENVGKVYANIGLAHYNKGNYKEAEQDFERAKLELEKTEDRNALAETYKHLAITNEKLNSRTKEVEYFRKYIGLKDSLLAEENQRRINEIKAEFEVQNQQKAIEILEHQKALLSSQAAMKDMAFRTNRILLIFFACLIILSILLLALLVRRHNAKKMSNLVLQNHLAEVRQQKNQIEAQKNVIGDNNKKLEEARKTIVQKNKLLQENNALLERTINERTLELYKAYQKLSFHVDNTALAVMEFNDRLELIRWSDQAERIFGWKAEEVMGKRFHEIGFVLEKDIDAVIKMMHDLLYGDTPRIYFQAVNGNKYDEILHIEWNTSVLLNKDGSVDSIMAIANDVTSREQAFVKLQASHRELDNFIYKASHDLRGPLARIQGVVNLGLMEVKEKLSRDYFNMLQITANQLNNILSRLLMTYDINHHGIKPEKVVLKKEIEEILQELTEENEHFNVRFKLKIPARLSWETDMVLFRIIVRNMFDNALFFRDKKEVKVQIEAQQIHNERLLISITDNGLGIPENVRDRVFDMFFHGSARSGGTGLGLYMAKKAIERLGGTIQLVNGAAKNTLFKIVLPTLSPEVLTFKEVEQEDLPKDLPLNQ